MSRSCRLSTVDRTRSNVLEPLSDLIMFVKLIRFRTDGTFSGSLNGY
jgi:hypothetical protein